MGIFRVIVAVHTNAQSAYSFSNGSTLIGIGIGIGIEMKSGMLFHDIIALPRCRVARG